LSINVYSQHKTIESVLKRGENLDNLVDKSNDLSSASQVHLSLSIIYTTGRKRCLSCIVARLGRESLFDFDIVFI
jgi:hypothetical protein